MSASAVRIVIVGDDPLGRAGLSAVMSGDDSLVVVGQVEPHAELYAHIASYSPDVILWDLGWRPEQWTDIVADLTHDDAGLSPTPLVALLPDADHAHQIWQSGARCLLLRSASAAMLRSSLLAAESGLITLDPALSAVLASPHASDSDLPLEPLTTREVDVLALLAEGLANKTIARRLEISEHTVKFHVNAILSKFGASSRTEAVMRATRAGLVLL